MRLKLNTFIESVNFLNSHFFLNCEWLLLGFCCLWSNELLSCYLLVSKHNEQKFNCLDSLYQVEFFNLTTCHPNQHNNIWHSDWSMLTIKVSNEFFSIKFFVFIVIVLNWSLSSLSSVILFFFLFQWTLLTQHRF